MSPLRAFTLLEQKDVSPNRLDCDGRTPLLYAARLGNLGLRKLGSLSSGYVHWIEPRVLLERLRRSRLNSRTRFMVLRAVALRRVLRRQSGVKEWRSRLEGGDTFITKIGEVNGPYES